MEKKQLFMVDLANPDSARSSHPSARLTKELMEEFISPILRNSSEVFLYPDTIGNPDKRVLSKYGGIFKTDRSRYRITAASQLLDKAFVSFWQDRDEHRGALAMVIPNSEALPESVFESCYDPIVLNNPEAYCGRSVIRFARKRLSESDDVICVIIPPGLRRALLLQSRYRIFDLYSTAVDVSRFSNSFLATYGAKAD